MLIAHQGRSRAARNLAVRQSYLILFGQAPAPKSDALPRRIYGIESDDDLEAERMTKHDIEAIILDLLPHEPGATTTALSQTAGVSSDRVFRVLLRLEEDGRVRREEIPHGQTVVKRWFINGENEV